MRRARFSLHDRLQVVDVVEEDLVEIADRRLDVARHRDVDDEERPAAPRPHRLLDVRAGEDRLGRAGGGDDDVGGAERVRRARSTATALAAELPRQRSAVRQRAAGDGDLLDALRLAGATPVSLAISPAPRISTLRPVEVAEDLLRQRDRRVADRHGAFAEAGFAAHALADGERGVEQAVESPRR